MDDGPGSESAARGTRTTGLLVVLVVGQAVASLAAPGGLLTPLQDFVAEHPETRRQLFALPTLVSLLLVPLLALLTDRVRLGGDRRRVWLALFALGVAA